MKTAIITLTYTMILSLLAGSVCSEHTVIESGEFLPVKTSADSPVSVYLVKFDLSEIPDQAVVDIAILRMTADVDSTAGPHLVLAAYPVAEDWTGSSTPAVQQTISFDSTMESITFDTRHTGRQIDLDITETVREWLSGERTNQGIVIIGHENPGSGIRIYTDNRMLSRNCM